MSDKSTNTWKVLGIVLIVVVILETLFIGWIFSLGDDIIEEENRQILNENRCIANVCGDYDSYYYDPLTQTCDCYNGANLVHTEVIF